MISFDHLNHDYQMKWVRVARAVVAENGTGKWQPSEAKLEEAKAIVADAPRRGMRIDYQAMSSEEERKKVRTAMHYLAIQQKKDKQK